MGVLPEGAHVLDRLKGLLAVDHDLLAALVDLRAAERPEVGVGEGRRVAEGMSPGLADRAARRLQLLAGVAILVPVLREGVVADLGEPGFPVVQHLPDACERNARPLSCYRSVAVPNAVETT